jgi:hypothetical protein
MLCAGRRSYFVLFGNSKQDLHAIKADITGFLERLRLRLHPKKTLLFPVAIGTNFLGYRIYPTHIRIRKENVGRFAQRMEKKQRLYRQGTLQPQAIRSSLQAWIAHASHAQSYRLRQQLFRRFVFHRDSTA